MTSRSELAHQIYVAVITLDITEGSSLNELFRQMIN